MHFGLLVDQLVIEFSGIIIRPLSNYGETIKKLDLFGARDGWLYPPLKKGSHAIYEDYFSVDPTHSIESTASNIEEYCLRFLILAYGFMHGFYLLPDKFLYFGRVPFKNGKLHALIPSKSDLEIGMKIIKKYYCKCSEEDKNQIFAILHWFLISGTFVHPWDHFDAQYKVLDGLCRLNRINGAHSRKPELIANSLNIVVPQWAETYKNNNNKDECKLSKIRNDLVHQALFAEKPIGYRLTEEDFTNELSNFNMKLICATLGLMTPYLDVYPDTNQLHGWDIKNTNEYS